MKQRTIVHQKQGWCHKRLPLPYLQIPLESIKNYNIFNIRLLALSISI